MAWLTVEVANPIRKDKEIMTHFDRIKKIYPSITREEYDRWIKSGMRAECLELRSFSVQYPSCYSKEKLLSAAECRVTRMVLQLIEAEKIIRKENIA